MDLAQLLSDDREQTVAQIASLEAEHAEIVAATELVATDDEHDPEGATIAFERARVQALLAQAQDHLVAIGRAEQRIVAGTYGRCERCGEPIGDARLEARPTAATCMTCATT